MVTPPARASRPGPTSRPCARRACHGATNPDKPARAAHPPADCCTHACCNPCLLPAALLPAGLQRTPHSMLRSGWPCPAPGHTPGCRAPPRARCCLRSMLCSCDEPAGPPCCSLTALARPPANAGSAPHHHTGAGGQVGSNNVVAIDSTLLATPAGRARYCGKKVVVRRADGSIVQAPDGGDFFVWWVAPRAGLSRPGVGCSIRRRAVCRCVSSCVRLRLRRRR